MPDAVQLAPRHLKRRRSVEQALRLVQQRPQLAQTLIDFVAIVLNKSGAMLSFRV